MMTRPRPPAERFWAKVIRDPETECWEWTGHRRRGYGNFPVPRKRMLIAHRFSYELNIGPIPAGFEIDHLCVNRGCVNPAHLEAVTPQENNARSRSPSAENARKTACVRGHLFDVANTYIAPDGRRNCRTCRRHAMRRYEARIRAVAS